MTNTIIQQSIDQIGPHQKGDYKLSPEKHAALFSSTPELAAVLSNSKLIAMAEEYEINSSRAGKAKNKYTKFSNRARWFGFLTAGLGAGVVMASSLSESSVSKETADLLVIIFAIGAGVSGLLGSAFLMMIKGIGVFELFKSSRAKAEQLRIDYFVTACSVDENTSPSLALLKLEYMRRYLLEMQKDYYKQRSEELMDKSTTSFTVIAILTAVAGIATLVVGTVGGQLEKSAMWIPIVVAAGLILQALASTLSNKEQAAQHKKMFRSYNNCRAQLNQLSGKLSEIRQSIANGNVELVEDYLTAVTAPLMEEHKEWLENLNAQSTSLAALEKTLASKT